MRIYKLNMTENRKHLLYRFHRDDELVPPMIPEDGVLLRGFLIVGELLSDEFLDELLGVNTTISIIYNNEHQQSY